jgi:hypothetical protein
MQVISDCEGKDEYSARASGNMGLAPSSRISQVSTTLVVAMRAPPLSHGGARPPLKKAQTKNSLSPSVGYVCEGSCIPFV